MNNCSRTLIFLLVLLCWLPGMTATANDSDWPQFLGPNRNGVVSNAALADSWPAGGPRVVWKKKVGEGFSGPVVAGKKVVLFHRLNQEEVLTAWDRSTGSNLWQYAYPSQYRDAYGRGDGPRATPAVSGGRVVSMGPDGQMVCLALEDGKKVWTRNGEKEFGARQGFFGLSSSPLILGERVVMQIGGTGNAGVVALDLQTGKELWRSGSDEASNASPIEGKVGGYSSLLVFTREGLVQLDPADGRVKWRFPWRSKSHASVNAATPLLLGDLLFLSASYETGAILLRLKTGGPEKIWSGDDILSNHFVTSVHHEGFLYGLDGRHEASPRLRCVELKTGKVWWTAENFGTAQLILAGGKLLFLKDSGELILARAQPDGFKPLAQAQVLGFQTRAVPALSEGYFFARDQAQLICLDLRPTP